MMLEELSELFDRDLNKLKSQLELYKTESDLWIKGAGISNSAGNLTLHILGNLNHFVGAVLGNTGYIRDRDFEFGEEKVMLSKLVKETLTTITTVKYTLSQLDQTTLEKTYPIEVFGKPMTTSFFLLHLHAHLNYHLGQINYHRRILASSAS